MLVAERPTPKTTPSSHSIRRCQHQLFGRQFFGAIFRVQSEVRERRGKNSGWLLRLVGHTGVPGLLVLAPRCSPLPPF